MYSETMTFIDFDGMQRTEKFYFNLTQQEVLKMDICEDGGMIKSLEKIIAEADGKRLYQRFESIVDTAYGEKSLDGRRFMKNEEILNKFKQTNAYSDLIIKLATNAEYAANFMNSILPVNNVPNAAPAEAVNAVSPAAAAQTI